MPTDNECVDYARDCVRLAGLTQDQQIRDRLLAMANEWMAEAIDEQAKPREQAAKR